VGCLMNSDCSGSTPICDTTGGIGVGGAANRCVECLPAMGGGRGGDGGTPQQGCAGGNCMMTIGRGGGTFTCTGG
jgi:hypothetical protein